MKRIFINEISLNGLKNITKNKRHIVQDYIYNQMKGTRLYESRESEKCWEKLDDEPAGLWRFGDNIYSIEYSEEVIKFVAREYQFAR